ncbi:hypothetical protein GCM10009775_15730 [Microbacterium aoyamense]|uniref:DUF4352 domain-containing protein n=1 Tax=Microbacterium aoyamense TaxID=344166 RepID=A0ABN2PNT0_9MICO|nr:hypothetical protein [Microbacterium aoyamense]
MTDGGAPQTRADARRVREVQAAQPPAPEPQRRFRWVRTAAGRVPTSWFAGIATALLLVVTAAFGGLATVDPPGPSTIAAGDVHVSDQYALTVESAYLQDADPDAGIYLDEGERMLIVRVLAENLWDKPQPTAGLTDNITIDGLSLADARAMRVDDATASETLQPGMPVELDFRLRVEDGEYHDGDTLRVTLNDLALYTGTFVMSGTSWTDPRPAAELTLQIRDAAQTEPS